MTTPQPPPWGQLITQCREAQIPVLSMREGARRAGFSVATWTQIEQGYRKVTSGITIPIHGTDDKLALMARVAGATPAQLAEAGRPEAASMLERLLAVAPDPAAELVEKVRQSREFSEGQKKALIRAITREAGG